MEQRISVMDGSDIQHLVDNRQVFANFVNNKFQNLDTDQDGKLSVKELQPAVADIGAALGLPPQGTSSDSDLIYGEVMNEFTQGGKEGKISKHKFKHVLSDILLGVAAGLKRDPIVILRMDGHDLLKFLESPSFEPQILSVYSEINSSSVDVTTSLKDCIINSFENLTVDQGMPPATDPSVRNNVIDRSLESIIGNGNFEQPISQEMFLIEFKRAVEGVARVLMEHPVIVAHSQNTFDGSGIKRLLSDQVELDKAIDFALRIVPKEKHGKMSKEYLGAALDALAAAAGLRPLGAVDRMDSIMIEALKMINDRNGKPVKEGEFKKLLTQVLGSIMLQLDGNPVSVSINSVVHEPTPSSSTLLQPSTTL